MTIQQAAAALLESKKRTNRRQSYLVSLRQYLALFSRGRELMPIKNITTSDIESWFANRQEKPNTMISNLGRLSSLFSFGVRRAWIKSNPCDSVEKPFCDQRAPKILTVDQCREILDWTLKRRPQMLTWLALCLFAGLRPSEADAAEWTDIDLNAGIVRIDGDHCKTRRRRIVHLHPTAVKWLRRARVGSLLPLARITRKRYLRQLRGVLQLSEWPPDVLRHTAASMLLACHRDVGKVAIELGNSPKILMRHYCELVSDSDATQFFSL